MIDWYWLHFQQKFRRKSVYLQKKKYFKIVERHAYYWLPLFLGMLKWRAPLRWYAHALSELAAFAYLPYFAPCLCISVHYCYAFFSFGLAHQQQAECSQQWTRENYTQRKKNQKQSINNIRKLSVETCGQQ